LLRIRIEILCHTFIMKSNIDTAVQFSPEKIIPNANSLDTLYATLEKMQFEEGERGK
jgi:hypothetical protein